MKKLNKEYIEDILSLTPMQEGMLFHYLKDPESDYYFEQLSLKISGKIDKEIFKKAWNFVIETNEMLRTVFRWEKVENLIQITLKEHQLQPKYYDFSSTGLKEVKKRLEELKVKDRKEKFDLREVPFRVNLCKTEENKYEMIISNHHILFDGWSTGIILREFFRAYNDLADGQRLDIPVKTKFREFVKWLKRRDANEEECYWKEYLEGFDTKTGLLVKRKRERDTRSARNYQVSFCKDIKNKIESMVGENKITLAYVFYSAWGILLQKYNNNRDVVFGTTVSGRSARVKGIENVVGLFLNTLPLRIIRRESESVMELLKHVNQTLRKREEFERTALVDIKNYSEIDKKEELFDSVLVIENYPLDKMFIQEKSRLSVNSYSMFGVTNYDITIRVEMKDDIKLNFIYNQELFNNKTVIKLSHGFRRIVTDIISNPAKKVSEIEILTEEEQRELLYDFNNTKPGYPGSRTIQELFEKQARQTPTKIAVVSENKQLTYYELNQKSNLLAGFLIKKGVNIDSIIAILVEPSLEMMVGIIAILKAGGAHLAIDPENTEEKVNYMLKESNAEILLTQKHLPYKVKPGIMIINLEDPGIYDGESSISYNKSDSRNLIYVIYTSGTTGKPKGVLINHKNLLNYVYWFTNEVELTSKDKTVLTSSFAFDLGYTLIYSSILTGGELHLIPKEKYLDAENLLNYIKQNQISYMKMTPSFLSVIFSEALQELRLMVVGGEQIRVMDIGKLYHMCNHIKVMNHYGPTETTIGSVARFIDFAKFKEYSENPTIGKPINNIEAYILDYDFKLSPIGVSGELYLSGEGVARGYLCRPELTSIKFIENPFQRKKMMYRTGDLSRWHPDGHIEFLGRIDNQVKIRGYRIEPGEIESKLLKQEPIRKTLVLDGEDTKGIKFLAAYIVSDEKINPGEIKRSLASELPGYMIPSHFIQVKEIPLTANGKVKRDALPKPDIKPEAEYVPPTTDIEESIARIWRELLGLEKVGVNENFFDVGGNSLYIIRLNSRLKEAFNQDIPVLTLFRYPTISAFAQYLTRAETPNSSLSSPLNQVTTPTGIGMTGHEAAVIGMSGRFSGAKNINDYWNNLIHGVESISYFTEKELETEGLDIELIRNSNYIKARGIVEGVEYFDAAFFNYTPVQAEIMDPQIRLFHECAWEALEGAGYNSESYKGLIGVYAGAANNFMWLAEILSPGMSSAEQFELRYLNNKYFSTLISYRLKLKGPSISMNTACSTSLVAIDMAYWDLLNCKCDMALAGGVTITYPNRSGYMYQERMIKSPDGHCRAFDERSAGTLEGNGIGIVVLKRLEDAINDGDHIYAVIKGSATNNDGERKVGYTAPSIEGQAEVIRAALRKAGVKPETIGYIEAHGTGTSLGDPVEIEGLKLAFNTDKKNFCGIGSVKTNIGHLDEAAGAAGFIKTVLSLKHKLIPPSLHFEKPNPKIDLKNSPFYINTVPKEWKTNLHPRRAGVSSFGIGGTNAHVILEEAPEPGVSTESRAYQLILLSARTESALNRITKNLAVYFSRNPGLNLADVSYTLKVGRKSFKYRRMLLCQDIEKAVEALTQFEQSEFLHPTHGSIYSSVVKNDNRKVTFMFSGQGSQYVNMGLDIYKKEPVFQLEMDRCFDILRSGPGYDIKEILYPGEASMTPGHEGNTKKEGKKKTTAGNKKKHLMLDINHTKVSQPVIFIIEYALAKLLMHWGIKPYAMIGHSLGEYTAACLAGVFSLEDALKLVALRGQLMQKMPAGSMVSVHLPEGELKSLLNNELSLAAVNEPNCCVVSGPNEAIAGFVKELKKRKIETRRLLTSHAFHSKMMEPILEEFKAEVSRIRLNRPQIPYISNVTGKWLTVEEVTDPGYWAMHLRETVRFSDGLAELLKDEETFFLEVSPGKALSTFARQHPHKKSSHMIIDLLRHPKQNEPDDRFLLDKIGQLWLNGTIIDWHAFYSQEKRHRIPLPTYPFERNRFWRDHGAPVLKSGEQWGAAGTFKKKDSADVESESLVEAEGTETPERTTWFQRPGLSTPYAAPQNDIEKELAQIWQNLFGIETVGIFDDFFELGGDSLMAITVILRIRKQLDVEVPLIEFFNNSTIEKIAKYINGAERKNYFSITSVEKKDYYPLSSAQKRMYIAHQMDVESVSYNITQVEVLVGNLDRKIFEETIRKLIMVHESFRTSFAMVEDEPIQRIHPDTAPGFKLEYFESAEEETEPIIKNFKRPYDLSKAPLLRVGLIKTGEAKHILILDMYHIISDGISQSILVEDFITLYQGRKLSPLKLQYKDFSQWQRKQLHGDQFKKEEEYWLSRFKGKIPVLELPTDYPRSPVQGFEGHTIIGRIEKTLTGKLEFIAAEYGVTLYMVLLASFTLLLSKYANQNDIIVGTPVAGRRHADLGLIVGMFVNVLLMRNSVEGKKSFQEFQDDVKNNTLKAFDNQDYPFDSLVERLGLKRETGRNPLYEVIFAVQNVGTREYEIPGLQMRPFEYMNNTVKTDLRLGVEEQNGELEMRLTYSTDLYKQKTACDMLRHYEEILRQVVTDKAIKIEDIKISHNLATLRSNVFKEDRSEFNF